MTKPVMVRPYNAYDEDISYHFCQWQITNEGALLVGGSGSAKMSGFRPRTWLIEPTFVQRVKCGEQTYRLFTPNHPMPFYSFPKRILAVQPEGNVLHEVVGTGSQYWNDYGHFQVKFASKKLAWHTVTALQFANEDRFVFYTRFKYN